MIPPRGHSRKANPALETSDQGQTCLPLTRPTRYCSLVHGPVL
jgi:hypothetical protein